MTTEASTSSGLLCLSLLAVLSWQAPAHTIQSIRVPPTYDELSTSLIQNQLAILQLMHDSSNASCAAVAMQREGDTVRKEAERLEEELGAQVDQVQETLDARQRQHMQQMFDALNRTAEDILTKLREEMREKLANVALEAQTITTPATEQPAMEAVPELPKGVILQNDSIPSLCDGNKTLYGTVGALEVVSSGTYPNNKLCSWSIYFPTGSPVSLSFEYMDIQRCLDPICGCDWVTVYDVTNSQLVYGRKLCETYPRFSILQLLNGNVLWTRNLLVTFRSDNSGVGRGFQMLYRVR